MTSNLAASVRARLLNLARKESADFGLMLNRYGRERLLYRISQSAQRERFVLKGATLFELWTGKAYRPTRDVDLLGSGSSDVADLVKTFREVCEVRVEDDGLVFLPQSVRGEEIRESQEYPGVRIRLLAMLDAAEIDLQVDIGFGDAVNPDPELATLSTLLDFPAPSIRAYPKETVVAEKYEAMVRFGMAHSRTKDFYDILILARDFDFEGDPLSVAIKRTFDRRKTALPVDEPIALTQGAISGFEEALERRGPMDVKVVVPASRASLATSICESRQG